MKDYHGVNIEPHLIFLQVITDLRVVLQPIQQLQFQCKNIHPNSITIEKGQRIAMARCCHGHYEDSLCFAKKS